MAALGFLLFDKWEATIKVEIVGSKHRFDTEGLPKDRWSGVTSMSGKEMLIAEKSTRASRHTGKCQSSPENRDGFTLIELLVVISILVLLMAILLPTLQRVRKQAKAVACQANLRQWSLLFKIYLDGYDGRFWNTTERHEGLRLVTKLYRGDYERLTLCPMAMAYHPEDPAYSSWMVVWQSPITDTVAMSYGLNSWVQAPAVGITQAEYYWGTCDVKGVANIPLFFDCAWIEARPFDCSPPREELDTTLPGPMPICINRHDGTINMLFMDSSVRNVGVKELWTLKWHRQFNTRGPWTKAGGVKIEDWPAWMRRFKDY